MDELSKVSLLYNCLVILYLKRAKFYLEMESCGLVSGSPKIGEQSGHHFISVSEINE